MDLVDLEHKLLLVAIMFPSVRGFTGPDKLNQKCLLEDED